MTKHRVPVGVTSVMLLGALLSGCGVQSEGEATSADISFIDLSPSAEPAGSTNLSTSSATIYLVRDQALVAVRRSLPAPLTVASVLDAIADGPTDSEQTKGLRTALLSPLVMESVIVDRVGGASVRLGAEPTQSGAAELVLAFGQIVTTITALPGVHSVHFDVDGEALSVPRGDGSLASGALTAADYAELRAESKSVRGAHN